MQLMKHIERCDISFDKYPSRFERTKFNVRVHYLQENALAVYKPYDIVLNVAEYGVKDTDNATLWKQGLIKHAANANIITEDNVLHTCGTLMLFHERLLIVELQKEETEYSILVNY